MPDSGHAQTEDIMPDIIDVITLPISPGPQKVFGISMKSDTHAPNAAGETWRWLRFNDPDLSGDDAMERSTVAMMYRYFHHSVLGTRYCAVILAGDSAGKQITYHPERYLSGKDYRLTRAECVFLVEKALTADGIKIVPRP
jgi:hypothetical protein